MIRIKQFLFCICLLYLFISCVSAKRYSQNEYDIQADENKSQESKESDEAKRKCSEELEELRKNFTTLYTQFNEIKEQMSIINKNVAFHERALKHIAYWAHKNSHNKHDHHDHHGQHANRTDELDDEDHRHHRDHNVKNKTFDEGIHDKHDNHSEEIISNDGHHHDHDQMNKTSDEDIHDRHGNHSEEVISNNDGHHHHHHHHHHIGDDLRNKKIQNNKDINLEHDLQNGKNGSNSDTMLNDLSTSLHDGVNDTEFKNWFNKVFPNMYVEHIAHNEASNHTESEDHVEHHHHLRRHHHHHDHHDNHSHTNHSHNEDLDQSSSNDNTIYATCEVRPNRHIALLNQQNIHGRVNLWQTKANSSALHMHIKLSGFKVDTHEGHQKRKRETVNNPVESEPENPTQEQTNILKHTQMHMHGFHVHEYGNLTRDCQSMGAHYNPFNNNHGGPSDEIRHLGDLGNIKCDKNGNTDAEVTYNKVSLFGEYSIIGKALVIHQLPDDYGRNKDSVDSITTGSAGVRIACCVIESVSQLPKEADSASSVLPIAVPKVSSKRKREIRFRGPYGKAMLERELMQEYDRYDRIKSQFEVRTARKRPNYD